MYQFISFFALAWNSAFFYFLKTLLGFSFLLTPSKFFVNNEALWVAGLEEETVRWLGESHRPPRCVIQINSNDVVWDEDVVACLTSQPKTQRLGHNCLLCYGWQIGQVSSSLCDPGGKKWRFVSWCWMRISSCDSRVFFPSCCGMGMAGEGEWDHLMLLYVSLCFVVPG